MRILSMFYEEAKCHYLYAAHMYSEQIFQNSGKSLFEIMWGSDTAFKK